MHLFAKLDVRACKCHLHIHLSDLNTPASLNSQLHTFVLMHIRSIPKATDAAVTCTPEHKKPHLFHCSYCHSTHKLGYSWNKKWYHQEPIGVSSNTWVTKRIPPLIFWQPPYNTSLCSLPGGDTLYPIPESLQAADGLQGTCHHIVHVLGNPEAFCHLNWGRWLSWSLGNRPTHYCGNTNHLKERSYLAVSYFL